MLALGLIRTNDTTGEVVAVIASYPLGEELRRELETRAAALPVRLYSKLRRRGEAERFKKFRAAHLANVDEALAAIEDRLKAASSAL